ncbi:MAG: type II secretion system protein GspD, partial [Lentisphaeria bacterium]|nr:type II secretion system protein GspD [Lentisphaeria bacterium]
RTTPRTYALVQALMERLDTPPLQVLIQATIVDLNLEDGLEYGFKYALDSSSGKGGASIGQSIAGAGSKGLAGTTTSGLNLFFNDGTTALNFIASVAGVKNTSVVSSPQVVAISDEEAKIDITDQISISSTVYTGGTGGNTNQNWESKDASTTLTVTPHITANNEVSLDVKVTTEEFDESQLNNYNDPTLDPDKREALPPPNLYKRSIETKLVVPDGETVLLGGMIKNKNTDYTEGIPWLMDIPYLGELFKYTSKQKRRSELLVLMTVTVVDQKTRLELLLKRYQQSIKSMNKVLGNDSLEDQRMSIQKELQENFKEHGERWDELFGDDEEVTPSKETPKKTVKSTIIVADPTLEEPKALTPQQLTTDPAQNDKK